MVQQTQITKAEFLNRYSKAELTDVLGPVQVGAELRLYARSTVGQAENPDRYEIVYCIV